MERLVFVKKELRSLRGQVRRPHPVSVPELTAALALLEQLVAAEIQEQRERTKAA